MTTLDLFVTNRGDIICLYDDVLHEELSRFMGRSVITRASHVEPSDGGWTADMGPSGGPVLGPFNTRKEALNREREWLCQNLFT